MKLKSPVFLIVSVALFGMTALQCESSFASRNCTQGPACGELNQAIKHVQEAKSKRHQDVHQYGKDSPQVKSDDLTLAQAVQSDREIRSERKGDEQGTQQHHSRHHKKQGAKHPRAKGHDQAHMDLTAL